MPTLYNAQTGQQETVPEDQLQTAILNKTHFFKKGDRVNVRGVDGGEGGSFESDQLYDALSSGKYAIEAPRQTAVREYVEDNKGLKGTVKVALGQFADEAAMGIPEIIYDKTADPLEVAKKEALKKEHEFANTVGGIGGFGASLLYGGPVGKMATLASKAGTKVVGQRLAAAGVEAGSTSIAKELAKKIAKGSVNMGVEGATYAAPVAITEAALGDPELAAETLLMNGIAGSAFGVIGAGAKGLLSLGKKAPVPSVTPAAGGLVPAAPEAAKETVFGRLTKRKGNADEIESAYRELGLEPLEGSLSDSKFIQDLDSALSKKVSPAGVARQEKWQNVFDATDGALREGLENAAPTTAVDAGDAIRKTLADQVEAKYAPFEKMYGDIRALTETVAIPDAARIKFNDKLFAFGDKNKGFYKEIKDFGDQIIAEDTGAGVESVIRSLKDKVNSAYRSGETNKGKVLSDALQMSEDFLEKEILRQARVLESEGMPEAQKLAREFIAQKATANKEYAGFKEFMGVLGDVSKMRTKGTRDFINALGDTVAVPSEKLVNKLFDKNNARALEWLKKESPEAFNTLVGYKKNELLQSVMKDDRIQIGRLLSKIDELSPQVKSLLFPPEQLKKMKAAEIVFRSMPKDVNPSGTARAMEFNQFLKGPGIGGATVGAAIGGPVGAAVGGIIGMASNGLLNNLADRATESVIRTAVKPTSGLLYTEKIMKKTALALDKIPESIEKMMSSKVARSARTSSVGAINRFLENPDTKMSKVAAFEDLSNRIAEFNSNPAHSTEKTAKLTEGLGSTGAPETANQLATKQAFIAKYLQDHMPKPLTMNTPFKQTKWQPTDAELSRFERRVHAIQEPLSLLEDMQDGTITPEAVDAVRAVYPKLFKTIQGRIMQHFMDKPQTVPYNQRIKMSLLLDLPLDNDLQPQNLMMFQQNFLQQDESAGPGSKPVDMPSEQTETQGVALK